ncbi:glycoside hydrolase family 10 protein [Xylariomycetidae sp. FL2044]|nr:glycoside hydrolase family 10 protein [Xylariomycetidae sp. FL2044]
MVSLRYLALCSLASGLAAADGLAARAMGAGKLYYGTAMSGTVMNDASAKAIGTNSQDFTSFTCENEMKFDATEPSRGTFSYTNADKIVAQAASTGQSSYFRCHTLVWHSQLPSWVSSGNFDNATMISIMKNHITNLMTHYKGKCYAWDVVNEALNEDGSFRNSVWYQKIGPAYIPIAFATAASVDPAAKLYYNDYNCDVPGSKATGAQNLIRMVKQYGARIDGMGLQGHMSVGSVSQANLVTNLNNFAALGVDVAYTELDINTASPQSSSSLAQQAADYASVVNACKAVARCVGITQWGVADKYTWISGSAPLPWDTGLSKKPAYSSMLGAFGTATAPPATTLTTTTAEPTSTGGGGSGCQAALYGQCGGSGWTGCTACASGSTCTYSNDWYSQCL